MPTACAGLTENVLNNCEKPITGGANDRIWLVNKSDIASTTPDPNNPYLITSITLNSGAYLYRYEGQNNSVDLRAALVRQRYTTVYDHEVIFKVFDNTPEIKRQLGYLGQGVVVAIVESNFKGSDDDSAFELYGLDAGLILNANESNKSSNKSCICAPSNPSARLPSKVARCNLANGPIAVINGCKDIVKNCLRSSWTFE